MRVRHASLVLLAGCRAVAPDYGAELRHNYPTAVGARDVIYLTNLCPGRDLPVPCDDQRGHTIRSVTLDDPSLVALEAASGSGPIVFKALRAGRTGIEVTFDRPDGTIRSAESTLELANATGIEVWPECSLGREPPLVMAPPEADLWVKVSLMGPRPGLESSGPTALYGHDFQPFDLGTLTVLEQPKDTLHFRVRLPEATTKITTSLDPGFARSFRSYRPEEVDGLRLTADAGEVPMGGATTIRVHETVQGTVVCRSPSTMRPRTAVSETPEICILASGGQRGPSIPVISQFEVLGRGPAGTCRITARHDDGGDAGAAEVHFAPLPDAGG